MKFFDLEDDGIINLEHITDIDPEDNTIYLSNGRWISVNPDLFKRIMCEIRKYMI